MKRTKLLISCIILLPLSYSCSKEEVNPLTFREAIIGKWELRETFDAINNVEEEWRFITPPFLSMNFNSDSTFVQVWDCKDLFSSDTYNILNQDSIIEIYDPIWRTIKPVEFNNASFINEFLTDEGIVKHKYFKVE